MTGPPEPVVVTPFDPRWAERFAQARDSLLEVFAAVHAIVEHVGSTSVPGLHAKPIVDVLLGVERIAEVDGRIPDLEARGWQYLPEHEDEFPERRFLARPRIRPRSHHLHAVEIGSPFWNDHLTFRDHLRAHPEDAAAYARLKRQLAERHRDDRPAYTEAKTAFIEAILARYRP